MKLKMGDRTNTYTMATEEARQKLRDHGLPTEFEALSIGHENGQFAIIPLDESSLENADELIRRWNGFESVKSLVATLREAEWEMTCDGPAVETLDKIFAAVKEVERSLK